MSHNLHLYLFNNKTVFVLFSSVLSSNINNNQDPFYYYYFTTKTIN